jgi:hypothetical protein
MAELYDASGGIPGTLPTAAIPQHDCLREIARTRDRALHASRSAAVTGRGNTRRSPRSGVSGRDHAARGVPHTLANPSPAATRYLLICTPAGFERRLARRAAEQAGIEPPAWALGPASEVTYVGGRIGDPVGGEPRPGSRFRRVLPG